jgi:hypothetical protein
VVLDSWTVPSLSAVDLEVEKVVRPAGWKASNEGSKVGTVVARAMRAYAAPSSTSVIVSFQAIASVLL